eukprot:TRINITY_DN7776_c0_g1_i10.p1 TRINITY_DN7776_c0_g1~~TRINITY_DN7776_c0_g1_i10.p1  ORF type:complete len:322 (-),score=114.57 TRINITY_DN7776_c0_g1_i10:95-931(-)
MDHCTTSCGSIIEAFQWLRNNPDEVTSIAEGRVEVYPPFDDNEELQQNLVMVEVAKRFLEVKTSSTPYVTLANVVADCVYKRLVNILPKELTFPLCILSGVQINFEGEDSSDFFAPVVCTLFEKSCGGGGGDCNGSGRRQNLLPFVLSSQSEISICVPAKLCPSKVLEPLVPSCPPTINPGIPVKVIKTTGSVTDEIPTGVEGETTWDEITVEYLSDGSERITTVSKKKLLKKVKKSKRLIETFTTITSTTKRCTHFPIVEKDEPLFSTGGNLATLVL